MRRDICPIGFCTVAATSPRYDDWSANNVPGKYSSYAMVMSAGVRICRRYFNARFRISK
jgi:hypothetical protein